MTGTALREADQDLTAPGKGRRAGQRDDGIADHTAFVPARLHVAAVRIPVIATHVTPRIRTAERIIVGFGIDGVDDADHLVLVIAVAVEHEEQIAFVAEIHPAVHLQSHGVIVRLQGGTKAAAGAG